MSAHQWSTNPSDNQTADARAQWPEGQPASSLNNSARGAMASAALWRDDHLGTLVATLGAGNVYSLATNEGLIDPQSIVGGGAAKITKPFLIRAVLPAMNTAVATTKPTIVIDGAAAVPLKRRDGSDLADGDLTGAPIEILGDTITTGAYSRARILNALPSDIKAAVGDTGAFPIGGILPFSGNNTPTGFLIANGAILNRTDYPKLWSHAQSSGLLTSEQYWGGAHGYFSDGNQSSTFRIPELRGDFLRAADLGRGLDPGRSTGFPQGDAFRSHTHSLTRGGVVISGYAGTAPAYVDTGQYLQIDTIAATGGSETRPVNVAYPFLIKAY